MNEITGVGALNELVDQDQILVLIISIFDAVATKFVAPQLAVLLNTILLWGLGWTRIKIEVSAIQPSVVETVNLISYTESTNDILSGILKLGCATDLTLAEANVFEIPVFLIVQLYIGIPFATVWLITPTVKFFEAHLVAPPTIVNKGFGVGFTIIGFWIESLQPDVLVTISWILYTESTSAFEFANQKFGLASTDDWSWPLIFHWYVNPVVLLLAPIL